MRSILSLKIN